MTRHFLLLVRFFRQFPLKKFEYALDLFILATEQQLAASAGLPAEEKQPDAPVATPKDHYEEDELITIKMAEGSIPASRTKIYEWRKEGKLQTVARGRRDKRLIRAEVEAMRQWARDKGKR